MSVGYLARPFDLINVADLDLVEQASNHCTDLIVGVMTDDEAEAVYGRRPIVPLAERLALVARVRGVRLAIVHGEPVPPPMEVSVIFSHEDHPYELFGPPHGAGTVIPLQARRASASVILRAALEPSWQQEAAS